MTDHGNEMQRLDIIRGLSRELQQRELDVAKARLRLNAAIRETEGLSNADIARAAGFSRQRVSKLREEVTA